jgi:hypothetical protein
MELLTHGFGIDNEEIAQRLPAGRQAWRIVQRIDEIGTMPWFTVHGIG